MFIALGRAVSAWEGVNAAVNSLFHALIEDFEAQKKDTKRQEFAVRLKLQDRIAMVQFVAKEFLDANFGCQRELAAKLKKDLKKYLLAYRKWAERRNELAHSYVTECQSPDYSTADLAMVTTHSLLPSHARADRWFHEEPEFNYVAAEVEEFARRFGHLDQSFERLAAVVDGLRLQRRGSLSHVLQCWQ